MNELFSYSPTDIVKTCYSAVVTRLFYRGARLIRMPFHIRGRRHWRYGPGFTTGYGCRFEMFGDQPALLFGKGCRIGDDVHIVVSDSVSIGDNLLCASHVFISDTSHGVYSDDPRTASDPAGDPNDRPFVARPVSIGDNVWIGENVVVLPGAHIGDGCVIGANSVVTRAIPPRCVAVGAPAKPIRQFDDARGAWLPYAQPEA